MQFRLTLMSFHSLKKNFGHPHPLKNLHFPKHSDTKCYSNYYEGIFAKKKTLATDLCITGHHHSTKSSTHIRQAGCQGQYCHDLTGHRNVKLGLPAVSLLCGRLTNCDLSQVPRREECLRIRLLNGDLATKGVSTERHLLFKLCTLSKDSLIKSKENII